MKDRGIEKKEKRRIREGRVRGKRKGRKRRKGSGTGGGGRIMCLFLRRSSISEDEIAL